MSEFKWPESVYDSTLARNSSFARILLIGPAKVGKTTCLATTAPGPVLVLNADGPNATRGAAAQLADGKEAFRVFDIGSRASWRAGRNLAIQAAAQGAVRTVIVDTVTMLSDDIVSECKLTLGNYELWDEIAEQIYGGIKELSDKLQAHLFVVAHIAPAREDGLAGILPMIAGQSKVKVAAALDDWIYLDVNPEEKPPRKFLLGPQKAWPHSGRGVKKSMAIEADVMKLFEELGIKP